MHTSFFPLNGFDKPNLLYSQLITAKSKLKLCATIVLTLCISDVIIFNAFSISIPSFKAFAFDILCILIDSSDIINPVGLIIKSTDLICLPLISNIWYAN